MYDLNTIADSYSINNDIYGNNLGLSDAGCPDNCPDNFYTCFCPDGSTTALGSSLLGDDACVSPCYCICSIN